MFFPVRQSDDECGERRKMEASAAVVAGGQLVVLASSNIARVYRVSTHTLDVFTWVFPLPKPNMGEES